jgi:hypothetical protein
MFLLRHTGDGKGPPVLGDIERSAGDLAVDTTVPRTPTTSSPTTSSG